MKQITKSNLDTLKNTTVNSLTSNVVVTKPTTVSVSGGIHSLADVDIHAITEKVSQAFNSAEIGTWAYNPSLNYALYQASMEINRLEKETTLNNLGADAAPHGDGTVVTTNRNQPSATASIDYITTFQKNIDISEKVYNENTTQTETYNYNNGYYSGLGQGELSGVRHNDLYTQSYNEYYDDDNQLTRNRITNIIQPTNINSIVYKTKQLFNDNKINTIVSAFHTKVDSPTKIGSAITPKYGMSHGRNLLLKSAERGNGFYDIHGYDNPYCRVWTHHYQYNRRDRLIRPFVTFTDSERENTTSTDIAEFHNFGKTWQDSDGGYAWKGGDVGWEMSVLHNDSKNGVVNIAPKLSTDTSHKTIRPIDCMFSIENLAWQGYDPYSFQKALSNEQRGPMGGRIMWFPPYDLSFSETVSVDWSDHNFIGRGETVSTYKNTKRSGSLNFTILVDHPSYTDLHLRHSGNITTGKSTTTGTTDTDFLRFFAGCDLGETPEGKPDDQEVYPEIKEEPIPEELLKFSFFVFYPNNYSGVHDKPGSKVEAIPYLLAGKGAQKQNNIIPTSELSEESKKKIEKLKVLKEWLIENYPSMWGVESSDDGAVEKWKCAFDEIGFFQMIEKFNSKTLLSKSSDTKVITNPLSMYCGHYNTYAEFAEKWQQAFTAPLVGEVNYSMEEFQELCSAKYYTYNAGDDEEKFKIMSQRFIYDVLDNIFSTNIVDLFEDVDTFWSFKDWTDFDTQATRDIKDYIEHYFDECFDKLFQELKNDAVLQKTLNGEDWKLDLDDIMYNIKEQYVADAFAQDRFNAEVLSETIKSTFKSALSDLGTPLVVERNGAEFWFHPEDMKLWESRTGFPLTAYNLYVANDKSNIPNARGWYHLYYNTFEEGYNVMFISNDTTQEPNPISVGVECYHPDDTKLRYIEEINTYFSSKSDDFQMLHYVDLSKFFDITVTDLKTQIVDLAKRYSATHNELGDTFAGCYFTTTQLDNPSKVMVYWYQSEDPAYPEYVSGWRCENKDYDAEHFVNGIWSISNGRQTYTDQSVAYALQIYYDYYYGVQMLLGLVDDKSDSEVKKVLGSQAPTQADALSKIDLYNDTIKSATTRSPYHYYLVLGPTRDHDSALDTLASEIKKYVNGEAETIDAITDIIDDYTPASLCDAIENILQSGTYLSDVAFDANTADKNSFSDMMNVVFTTMRDIEKAAKDTKAAADNVEYNNSTEVDDEKSDIAISMDKLFEADGVGYEMLKPVASEDDDPQCILSYDEIRENRYAYGISNVQRHDSIKPSNRRAALANISDVYDEEVSKDKHSGAFPQSSYNTNLTWAEISDNHIKGTRPNWQQYKGSIYKPSNSTPKQNNWDGYNYIPWYYRIDGKYTVPNVKNDTEVFENYYDQLLAYNRIDKVKNNAIVFSNYRDSVTYGLNCDIKMVKEAFQIKDSDLTSNKETLYSLAEVAYTIADNSQIRDKIIEQGLNLFENDASSRIFKLALLLRASKVDAQEGDYEIVKIEALGYSNSHANNKSTTVNKNRNIHLATNRAKTVVEWFKQNLPNLKDDVYKVGVTDVEISPSTNVGPEPNGTNDVSSLKAKQYRSAKVTIYVRQNKTKDYTAATKKYFDFGGTKVYIDTTSSLSIDGMLFAPTTDGKYYYHIQDKSIWEKDKDGKMKKVVIKKVKVDKNGKKLAATEVAPEILRYDDENRFFRELQIKDPIVFAKLVDKLQVFDPAFHSMTPEGFNARLTFLHQCTRQGDTHTLSDTNRVHTPKNLQFGKAPICILRIGDFYHQQIIIRNMQINYEPLSWDLNTEGIGVQPMFAKITLSFDFIGGGDMAGAVQRLQNAATFNYYANTRLYDNRADRVVYEKGDTGIIDTEKTYSHNVPYAGIDTKK